MSFLFFFPKKHSSRLWILVFCKKMFLWKFRIKQWIFDLSPRKGPLHLKQLMQLNKRSTWKTQEPSNPMFTCKTSSLSFNDRAVHLHFFPSLPRCRIVWLLPLNKSCLLSKSSCQVFCTGRPNANDLPLGLFSYGGELRQLKQDKSDFVCD